MTYIDIYNAFKMGGEIRARSVVAVAKYALYIKGEDPTTLNHANRLAWANVAILDAETEVNYLAWMIAGDQQVITSGDLLDDPTLQSIVETHINTSRISP